MRPHGPQPTRLRRPWDSPGKNTGVGCHFLLQCMKVKSESEVTQSCPTLRDPMDCSLPGSTVHEIFQARVLECGAIAFSGQGRCLPYIDSDRHKQNILRNMGMNQTFVKQRMIREPHVQPYLFCNLQNHSAPAMLVLHPKWQGGTFQPHYQNETNIFLTPTLSLIQQFNSIGKNLPTAYQAVF